MEAVIDFIFLGSQITVDGDHNHEIQRHLTHWKESYDKPRRRIKKQRHHFANKGPDSQSYDLSISQSYGLSISHVQMWELDHDYL